MKLNTGNFLYRWMVFIFYFSLVIALSACHKKMDAAGNYQSNSEKFSIGKDLPLTISGYNYTDRYIDLFSVNDNSGGNLFISGPNGGGGGSVCCISYISGVKDWSVTIRWQADACFFNQERDVRGIEHQRIHSFFKEIKVKVDPNIPNRPKYFEVHFYPDGHVEAALTESSSAPRLILSKDRENKKNYPQCPGNKNPDDKS